MNTLGLLLATIPGALFVLGCAPDPSADAGSTDDPPSSEASADAATLVQDAHGNYFSPAICNAEYAAQGLPVIAFLNGTRADSSWGIEFVKEMGVGLGRCAVSLSYIDDSNGAECCTVPQGPPDEQCVWDFYQAKVAGNAFDCPAGAQLDLPEDADGGVAARTTTFLLENGFSSYVTDHGNLIFVGHSQGATISQWIGYNDAVRAVGLLAGGSRNYTVLGKTWVTPGTTRGFVHDNQASKLGICNSSSIEANWGTIGVTYHTTAQSTSPCTAGCDSTNHNCIIYPGVEARASFAAEWRWVVNEGL